MTRVMPDGVRIWVVPEFQLPCPPWTAAWELVVSKSCQSLCLLPACVNFWIRQSPDRDENHHSGLAAASAKVILTSTFHDRF